jgi:hypothetical protein
MDEATSPRDIDRERRQAEFQLRRMLENAEASGVCEDSIDQIWAEAEAEYLARHL